MVDKFDLVILGSGSTAFAAALTAQELGKTAVMTEERVIGGTCVNRGCLPSKNLLEAARLLYDARNPRYPGLKPCEMELDFPALIAQKDEVVHGYRKKKYESLVGGRVSIEKGHVQFIDSHTVEVNGKRLSGEEGADRHRLPPGTPSNRGTRPGVVPDERPAHRRRVDGVAGTASILVDRGQWIHCS